MNKKIIFKFLKNCMRFCFLIFLIITCINAYQLYKYYETYPQTKFIFNSYEKPSIEYTTKISLMQTTRDLIYYCLLFYVLFEVFCFLEKPKKHWMYFLNEKINEVTKKGEI